MERSHFARFVFEALNHFLAGRHDALFCVYVFVERLCIVLAWYAARELAAVVVAVLP